MQKSKGKKIRAYWLNFSLNSPNLGGVFWGVRGKYSHTKIEKSITNYGQSSGADMKPIITEDTENMTHRIYGLLVGIDDYPP